MAVLKPQRSAVVGDAPDSVISIGYALAKAKSATDANAIMQTVPHASYAALKAHMNARPNLSPTSGSIARLHLKEDEHFYSQRVFVIFVNTDEHEIEEKHISYLQVVELYLGSGGKPSNEYLVKYSHGPAENPKGTLAPGQEVAVKDGMRFRVAGTGES